MNICITFPFCKWWNTATHWH